jgi:hypothetical protein
METLVVIEVSGGVVTEVRSNTPIKYLIKDWDAIKAGDPEPNEEDIGDYSDA